MNGIRCFVAVDLPGEMLDAIGRLQSQIATEGLRLVRPELVHVTIKFLGDVPETEVGRVKEALSKVVMAPFPAHVAGMGTFPGRDVRVVWLGLEGDFDELYEKVESALRPRRLRARGERLQPPCDPGSREPARAGDESRAQAKDRLSRCSGAGPLQRRTIQP